jgi:WD40 repeat protein
VNFLQATKHLQFSLLAIMLAGCQPITTNTTELTPATKIPPKKIPPNIQFTGVVSQINAANASNSIDLIGHKNQVIDLAFSRDGSVLASASYDKTVHLWPVGSDTNPIILRGHTKGVHSVAVSPRGRYIASGGWDRQVILWDALTGKKYKKFRRHRKGISALSFTPNGKLILTGDYGGRLNVWNVKTGKLLGTLYGHKLAIQAIVVSPDGKVAASAGADGYIRIWDLASLAEVKNIRGHKGLIKCLTFSPDGRLLYSGGTGDNVILWNVADGRKVRTIGKFTGSVNSLSISPDGKRLLVAEDQNIHLWDIELEEIITSLQPHRGAVSAALFSPSGNLVGSASYDNSIKLWEPPSGIVAVKEGQLQTHDPTVDLTGTVSDTDLLASVTLNGNPLSISADGSFNISRQLLVGENNFNLVAVDEQGNKSDYTLVVERQTQKAQENGFPEIVRPEQRRKENKNRVAIIIGIEDYKNVPNAKFAENDSRLFYEFATNTLAIPPRQIQLIYGENATRATILKVFTNWLKSFSNNPDMEVFVFYSGHGLSEADGSDAYFLPVDGDPALLKDTAISRKRLLGELASINTKSSTLFLDTCYSGITRSGESLISGQRPIVITPTGWQGLSPNVSIFAASSQSEISTSLNEQEHGLFSYFLMRALNGEADRSPHGNQDGKITLKEISDYVGPNVSRAASSRGQKQTPQLLGAGKTVIARQSTLDNIIKLNF